jgi:hypothetical protein
VAGEINSGRLPRWTIVGVAADTRSTRTTRESIEPRFNVPLAQRFEDSVPIEILARAADRVDPGALAILSRTARLRRASIRTSL